MVDRGAGGRERRGGRLLLRSRREREREKKRLRKRERERERKRKKDWCLRARLLQPLHAREIILEF
jgi:hypothetical protein